MDMRGHLHGLVNLTAPPRGKSPAVPTGMETAWVPESVWKQWRRNKTLAIVENRTRAVNTIDTPTELSWFLQWISTSDQKYTGHVVKVLCYKPEGRRFDTR
jgi:hypothetical protein